MMQPGGEAMSAEDAAAILAGGPQEWVYTMRRSMQEIVPNIFLGPYACAMRTQLDTLRGLGITHIVCVRQECEARFVRANFTDHFEYLIINLSDDSNENIISHFPRVSHYIDGALARGGRVLMHGNAGISRSGALLIAYIMQKHDLKYQDALRLVQLRRFCVSPNEGFQQQLMEYEAIYKSVAPARGGGVVEVPDSSR